jgi:hypothetical protein
VFDNAATPSPQGISPCQLALFVTCICIYRIHRSIQKVSLQGFIHLALRLRRHLCDTNFAQIYSLACGYVNWFAEKAQVPQTDETVPKLRLRADVFV